MRTVTERGISVATFVIARVTVTDQARYRAHERELLCAARLHSGNVLAAASEVETVEGSWDASRTIIIEFETQESAAEWTEAQRVLRRTQRTRSAITDMILLDGNAAST
jgi:uncharacterized protein (DUF1330 family)